MDRIRSRSNCSDLRTIQFSIQMYQHSIEDQIPNTTCNTLLYNYTGLRYVQALPGVHYRTLPIHTHTHTHTPTHPHTHTPRELSGGVIGRAQFPPASLQWTTRLGSHGNRRVYGHLVTTCRVSLNICDSACGVWCVVWAGIGF